MQNTPIENLLSTQNEIRAKQDEFLSLVPVDITIGNKALKQALKHEFKFWSNDLYWAIRNSLIDSGVLETGRGRGGSVKKVTQSNDVTNNATQDYKNELELYKPIATVLENDWAKYQRFYDCYVEITAKGGAKNTNGKWTRPDIMVVGCKTFPYVPGKHLDVITFEVKPANAIDISGVYEALAHRRAATKSYLIVHIPTEACLCKFNATDIEQEAKKFGIGVIIAENPEDHETWEEKVEAQRIEPDPYKLNDFIAQQATPELKDQIEKWVKEK